ncbi:MAG: secondary thiamine-phosphate synthase enzyme YjbQ [Sulfolobales archaeon]|jgi:secondary thiamine-phosphate synthase enzyme
MGSGFRVYMKEVEVSSKKKFEVIRITELVKEAVRESGIKDGLVLVYVPHATATVIVNEYEPRICEDYIEWLRRYVPPNIGWRHDEIDDNAHAHIASAIVGPGRVIPVHNGKLLLGTWQEIMLVELDGPRPSRKVIIEVIGG